MLLPFLLPVSALAGTPAQAETISTLSLVREMTDLSRLAQYPEPFGKVMQFSSYDRRSVAPYAPDWFANSDGFGREPIPGFLETLREPGEDGVGTYLLADVVGPGAIVRTWTAVINGQVAVFLDGSSEPMFEGSAAAFLGDTYSALAMAAGLIEEPIGEGFRQCEACYFPIAFSEGLRIEWTGKLSELHFYHLEVRHYPPGTAVRTFSPGDLRECRPEIERALGVLRRPTERYEYAGAGEPVGLDVTVEPGGSAQLADVPGPGAIQELVLKVGADDMHRALRQVILRAYFDGASQPQIEAPVGDFFGSGPGVSPFDTLPMTVAPDGAMTCRFVMPFRASARLHAINLGEQEARVTGRLSVRPYEWREGSSMHFHATWRVDHDLVAGNGDDAFDVPYLCARGKGTLVGVAAMLLNPSGVPTSSGNWWGEGDEKVYTDDDTFPSLFGTGSEDYYNYAWSRPTLFDHAYCAQPLTTGPDNRGFVSNIRWHILDALPFNSSIGFYMELLHHGRTPGFSYARAAYYYASEGVRDDHIPITRADVTAGLELPRAWRPVAAGAATGAVFYQAEDALVADQPGAKVVEGRMWSAGRLVEWEPSGEGETLQLRLQVAKAGRYQLAITSALTPASGRYAVSLDGGETLHPVVDLYTPYQTMLRNALFALRGQRGVGLEAGEHVVTVTSRGRSDASAGTRIGIDFLWLVPRD